MIPVQFIIKAATAEECVKQAEGVLAAGGKWIELDVASLPDKKAAEVAGILSKRCGACGATFCVADDVVLCKTVGAEGVCLSNEDCRVDEVREALGHEFIIGAVASDFDRLKLLKRMSADYVRLCASEGLERLSDVIREVHEQQLRLPICVNWGGLLNYADAKRVIEAGADGIAINCSAEWLVSFDEAVSTLLHLDD